MAKIVAAGVAPTMGAFTGGTPRYENVHPTAPSYERKHSCLVRRAIDGKPRFEYNPANAPISLYDMLAPEEQKVIEEFRRDFRMPEGSNVNDPRFLVPDSLPEPSRSVLQRLIDHFPLSNDLDPNLSWN